MADIKPPAEGNLKKDSKEVENSPVNSKELKEEIKDNIHDSLKTLINFQSRKILFNNANRKVICLEGSFKDSSDVGIILLEKPSFEDKHFHNENGSGDFFVSDNSLDKLFHNDIYGSYMLETGSKSNSIKTTLIYPATQKHIEKYSVYPAHIIEETPSIYNNITLSYILEGQLNLEWVYNILEHKQEADRIVFEDTDENIGFLLAPDLKWNGTTIETLYLLAISVARDIKSLRDLDGKHLPLLRNIKENGLKAIEHKYSVNASRLRVYIHYQPSFYHFHVHFTYLQYEAPGIVTERAHLLTEVINNLEIDPDYYKKATISYVVHENNKLFQKFEEVGYLTKAIPRELTTSLEVEREKCEAENNE